MKDLFSFITTQLEAGISWVLGDVASRPLLGEIAWGDLIAVMCYLMLAVAVSGAVTFILGRRSQVVSPTHGSRHAWNLTLAALRQPVHIFIWMYAIYLAATPILLKLKPEHALAAVSEVLDVVFNAGLLFALFWFLIRSTNEIEKLLATWAARKSITTADLMVPLVGATLRTLLLFIAVIVLIPLLELPAKYSTIVERLTSMVLIVAIAALLVRTVSIGEQLVVRRFDITAADNLRARTVYTQTHVISRVIYLGIGVVAVAAILMLFPQVRHVGTSILASAGVLGIVVGFAAQKTLGNLLAGFQVALAQPIRQDDVVVVEGEWGRIEEITLTYVVVHIWDDRRLVLPLSYFIEKPFQNWTRASAQLLGSVFVYVDYSFPLEDARLVLKTIIEACPLWDKRFWNLQVTDSSEKTLQLRILATASDSSRSFDLRCEIREKFIAHIQRFHPEALPRLRAEMITASGSETNS